MKIKDFIKKLTLRFGERIALVPLIIIFAFIITLERVDEASAQQRFFKQNYRFDGLIVMSGTLDNIDFGEEKTPTRANSYTPFRNNVNTISVEVESVRVPVTPTPTPVPVLVDTSSNDIWERIASCESKGNWSINTGNGYFGGLQFSQGAWISVGGSGLPSEHSKEEQIERGKMLQARRGWGAWGLCAQKLNLL